MALNDRDITLGGNKGVDAYPGVANPTIASMAQNPLDSNFVTDPTTDEVGAGAGTNFTGDKDAARIFKQTAGVVEGRPGIIESTNIDPLNENSNKDDGWANVKQTGSQSEDSYAKSATSTAQAALQAGKEAVFGK